MLATVLVDRYELVRTVRNKLVQRRRDVNVLNVHIRTAGLHDLLQCAESRRRPRVGKLLVIAELLPLVLIPVWISPLEVRAVIGKQWIVPEAATPRPAIG